MVAGLALSFPFFALYLHEARGLAMSRVGAILAGTLALSALAHAAGGELSDLRGAKLHRANLSGANLVGARFDILPIGTGGGGSIAANLQRAKLRGAKLAGADLSNANLEGCDFSKADLRHADLRGAKMTDADFTDAVIDGAKLKMSDLTGAKGLPRE